MSNLKPCPSCKSNDVALNTWSNSSLVTGCFIRCYSCQTCGPTAEDIESAYEEWNNMPRIMRQEDMIELPKDAEDIPVHPGDVLYGGEDDDWVYHVDEIIYKADEENSAWSFTFKNDGFKYTRNPEWFSHHPQTALDEIKRDVYYLAKKSCLQDPHEIASDIMKRIKELKQKDKE